jgi:hypothetical protein
MLLYVFPALSAPADVALILVPRRPRRFRQLARRRATPAPRRTGAGVPLAPRALARAKTRLALHGTRGVRQHRGRAQRACGSVGIFAAGAGAPPRACRGKEDRYRACPTTLLFYTFLDCALTHLQPIGRGGYGNIAHARALAAEAAAAARSQSVDPVAAPTSMPLPMPGNRARPRRTSRARAIFHLGANGRDDSAFPARRVFPL